MARRPVVCGDSHSGSTSLRMTLTAGQRCLRPNPCRQVSVGCGRRDRHCAVIADVLVPTTRLYDHARARGTPERREGALHALKSNRVENGSADIEALSGAYRVFAAQVDQIRAGIASPRQQAPIEFNPRADWARIGFVGSRALFGFEIPE